MENFHPHFPCFALNTIIYGKYVHPIGVICGKFSIYDTVRWKTFEKFYQIPFALTLLVPSLEFAAVPLPANRRKTCFAAFGKSGTDAILPSQHIGDHAAFRQTLKEASAPNHGYKDIYQCLGSILMTRISR